MKARLKYKDKEVIIEDIRKVSAFGKFKGLMFTGKNASALLFEFKKGKAIHSFFCKPFLAIWLYRGKIIDFKIVKPFVPMIKPEQDFDQLIEVPLNEKYEPVIGFFLEHEKI